MTSKFIHIQHDVDRGIKSERELQPIIEQFFHTQLKKTQCKFSVMDWIGTDNCFYELKTRFSYQGKPIYKNTFDTTIVPMSKIEWIENRGLNAMFIFQFADGLFFIRYLKDTWDKFETQAIYCSNRTGSDPERIHICIPVNLLIPMIPIPCEEIEICESARF